MKRESRPCGELDIGTIKRTLRTVQMAKFLKASFGYGDELLLHFGGPVARTTKKLQDDRGGWVLRTQGTGWRISGANDAVMAQSGHSSDESVINSLLGGASVIRMEDCTGYGCFYVLHVYFDNGLCFSILPRLEDCDPEVPFWELLTPQGDSLSYAPDGVWTFVEQNVVPSA